MFVKVLKKHLNAINILPEEMRKAQQYLFRKFFQHLFPSKQIFPRYLEYYFFQMVFCRFATFGYLYFSYFYMNEPELGIGIDPGMAFNPFPSSILDKTRFEPTTFRL
jgi:hypothetical protein